LRLSRTAAEIPEDFAWLRFDELQDRNEVKVAYFTVYEFCLPEHIELSPSLVAEIVAVCSLK